MKILKIKIFPESIFVYEFSAGGEALFVFQKKVRSYICIARLVYFVVLFDPKMDLLFRIHINALMK